MAATSYCAGVSADFATFMANGKLKVKITAKTRLLDACYPMVRNMNYLGKAYMDMLIMTFITDNYVEFKTHYMSLKNEIGKIAKAGGDEESLNNGCKMLLTWIPKTETYLNVTLYKKMK